MCGRFATTYTGAMLAELFDVHFTGELPPSYNVAPSQQVYAIRAGGTAGTGGRELCLLQWGLIPSWAKDPAIGNRMINARSETVAEKPSFRSAIKRRRCLVPVSGYFEWQKTAEGKQPVYIHMEDGSPFAVAGLWERWQGQDGSEVESCTLITTAANESLRSIHHRMPVILQPGAYSQWLDPALSDTRQLTPLFAPYPIESLVHRPVSTVVNNPRNNTPECIAPLE